MSFFEHLTDFIESRIEKYRLGVYLAKNGSALDQYNRVEIVPEFMTDAIRNVRVVSSPLLDVEAPSDATLAVVSQDGVPSAPISLGVMYSNAFKPEDQTVWIRARLNTEKGFLDIGSEKGIRILVGAEKADLNPIASGKVAIGNGSGELVRDTHAHAAAFSDFLEVVKTWLNAESTRIAANAIKPLSGEEAYAPVPEAALLALEPIEFKLSQIINNLNSLKE